VIAKTDTETVIHTSIDLPMMFSDRDIVTRGVSSADPKTGTRDRLQVDRAPAVPPREGFIPADQDRRVLEFVPDGATAARRSCSRPTSTWAARYRAGSSPA
jgi:hypothetical protein